MKIPNHTVLSGALESMGVGAEDHAPVVAVAAARQIAYELPIPASPVNSPTEAFEVHRPVVEAKLAEVNEVMPINDFDGAVETVRAHWGARVRAVHQPETLQGLVDARVMAAAAAPAPVETLDAVAATVGAIMDRPAVESYLYAPHELLDLGLDQAALESIAGNDVAQLHAHYDAVLLTQGLAMADIYAGLEDVTSSIPVDVADTDAAVPAETAAPAEAAVPAEGQGEAEKGFIARIVDAVRRMFNWIVSKLKALTNWVLRRKDKQAALVEVVEKHEVADSIHAVAANAEKIVEVAEKAPELVMESVGGGDEAEAPAAAEEKKVVEEKKKEVVDKVKAAGDELKSTLTHLKELEEKSPGILLESIRAKGDRSRRFTGFFDWLPEHATSITKVIGMAGDKELRSGDIKRMYISGDIDWAKGLSGEMFADKARDLHRQSQAEDDGHRKLAVKDLIALWRWSIDGVVSVNKAYNDNLLKAGKIREANVDSDANAVRAYWKDVPDAGRYARAMIQDGIAVHAVAAQMIAAIGDAGHKLDQYMGVVNTAYKKLSKVIGTGNAAVDLLVKAGVNRHQAENTVKIMVELKG